MTAMTDKNPEFKTATLDAWAKAAAKSAPGGNVDALNWITPDGIAVKPLYTAADTAGLKHADTLPGFEPYLRGPQATMYAVRPWTIRQYAGFSTAEESNAFYRKALAAGRMGNFINGELVGRVTDVPWAMVFPQVDGLARHPSQLYQFALEGLSLFFILWWFSAKPRPRGLVSAVFLIGYGAFRFIAEFGREPDDFLGLLTFGMSMGQWLSLPMIAAGLLMAAWAAKRQA